MVTATSLADLLGVSPATISSYEHDRQKPPAEIVEKIASTLNVSVDFFTVEVQQAEGGALFFRSMSSATKLSRTRARRKLEWLREIVTYVSEHFDFPHLDLPPLSVPHDFRKIDSDIIEEAAANTRAYWGVPSGPAPNLSRLAESKGIVVSRGKLEAEGLDAFSQWSALGFPFVFLGSDKASAVRSRFDIAHEIGHLVLHKHVTENALRTSSDYKLIETQAHKFASAFLLPARDFTSDLYAPSLDSFRLLKPRWKVSIACMIKRSSDLGLINEVQSKRLWIGMSRREWRKTEPLDDSIKPELPCLLAQCIRMMVDENFKSKEEILSDIRLSPYDAEELCSLDTGYFQSTAGQLRPRPKFAASNIIAFDSNP